MLSSGTDIPIASAARTSDLAVANTETVVIGRMFPAEDLPAGATFVIRAFATRVGTTSAAPTMRVRVGPATLQGAIAAVLTPPGDALAVGIEIECLVTIRTAGLTGTVSGAIKRTVHLAAVTISAALGVSTTPVAVNTTVPNLIELTFVSGHANNTFTFRNAVIHRVN